MPPEVVKAFLESYKKPKPRQTDPFGILDIPSRSGQGLASLPTTNTSLARLRPNQPRPTSEVDRTDLRRNPAGSLRTSTDGAKKPLPKVRNFRTDFAPFLPVTSSAEFNRQHPVIPKSAAGWADYWENDDRIKQDAISRLPMEPARFEQAVATGQPDVETHLANPELTRYDNVFTNYAGMMLPGISELKDSQMRGKPEFLRISTPEAAKQYAGAMQKPSQWRDYLNPKTEASQELQKLASGGRVRSNYEDDPAALAMGGGAGRILSSIVAGDSDIQNATNAGLLGRGFSSVLSPSQLVRIFAGDLRKADDVPEWEQGANAVFDFGTQLATGSLAERAALSLGGKALLEAGAEQLLKNGAAQTGAAAAKQGFAQGAKQYAVNAGKAGFRSLAENSALQTIPRIGRASDLSQGDGAEFIRNFGRLALDDAVSQVRSYDPRLLADPSISTYDKVQILVQHGLSLYANRGKAYEWAAQHARENRIDPNIVYDLARQARVDAQNRGRGQATRSKVPESPKPDSVIRSAKLDRALERASKASTAAANRSNPDWGGGPKWQPPTKAPTHPEILVPGQIPGSEIRNSKILVPGQDPLLDASAPVKLVHPGAREQPAEAEKPGFKAPYIWIKQGPDKDRFMRSDLEQFLRHLSDHELFDIPATMVDRTHVGLYYNPETGAFFETQGGHDAGLTQDEYGKIAMRNFGPGADRLHRASGALRGLTLAYVGAPEANLSSAHSAHAARAEIEAALRNGTATENQILGLIRATIKFKHETSWRNVRDKHPVPNSLEEFFNMIHRDAMTMPKRKELIKGIFSKQQDLLPNYQDIIHHLSSDELRDATPGDVVAAIYLDPHSAAAAPSRFGVTDHLAYNRALGGIHLGKTRPVNIRELFAEDFAAARTNLEAKMRREGRDPATVTDGMVYSLLRYRLEKTKGRMLLGRTNAERLGQLTHD